MFHSSSFFRHLAGVAALLVLAGCSSSSPSAVGRESVDAPPVAAPNSADYTIGPGDALSVFVWRNQDLSTEVQVRPDGKISIPLVDDMQAVDKTPSQLATDIETVLAEYIRTPDVTVIVSRFGIGAYDNQIRVVGAGAVRPQAIPFRQGLTLLDVLIEVGLAEFAAGDRAKLLRRVNGVPTEIPVKLDRLINRGSLSQDLPLLPGDVLIIPETRF
jgi:polysaccharide biosynthesis/export protein